MFHRIMQTGAILASVLVIAACNGPGGSGESGDAEESDEEIAVPVEAQRSTLNTVYASYKGTTTLEAEREADVVAKTSGIVLDILVEEGDTVEAGQVVARLERDRLELELERAKATLDQLRKDYDRSQELFNKKLISSDAYERARSDLDQQQASFDMARLELSYTEVRTPIGGVVSERMVKVGKLVNVYEALFRVHDFNPLLAEIFVPERELSALRPGQSALLELDALAQDEFSGQLARVSPVVDPDTGTFKVTIEIRDPDPRLKPGMFGRVNIVYDVKENVVTIPQDALIIEDRERYVYVVENDRARRVDVVAGYVTEGRVEILQGLDEGEEVVTAGKGSIAGETLLDVINREAQVAADSEVSVAGAAAQSNAVP
ncbi:MAG: efflux RND transporter periplasmic adaptor subunit [Xanthomonadales bacterium]|nr:efflux RND transporter periplasmic adaptor subunit [Xanthomonadales bacterium]